VWYFSSACLQYVALLPPAPPLTIITHVCRSGVAFSTTSYCYINSSYTFESQNFTSDYTYTSHYRTTISENLLQYPTRPTRIESSSDIQLTHEIVLLISQSIYTNGPGSSVGIATDYGVDESRWGWDFPPVQTGPGAHPASWTMGTRSFPGVKCGRGVLLTTHPLLAPRSWKGRAIPLPPLGHNRACNGVTLPFTLRLCTLYQIYSTCFKHFHNWLYLRTHTQTLMYTHILCACILHRTCSSYMTECV